MLFPQVKAFGAFLRTDQTFLAGLVKSASQQVSNDVYSCAGEHTHMDKYPDNWTDMSQESCCIKFTCMQFGAMSVIFSASGNQRQVSICK